jgi:hypothetical protein
VTPAVAAPQTYAPAPPTYASPTPYSLAPAGDWTPPAGLRNHAGYRLDGSQHFPWGPPPAIGQILFADSNVAKSGPPSFLTPWLIVVGIWIAVYVALGEVMPVVIQGKGDPMVIRYLAIGFGLCCGLFSLIYTWPAQPRCTFVGTHGAAYLLGKWGWGPPAESQIIVFREITVLFAQSTHHYKNLMYQETTFCFDWHSHQSQKPLLRIAGEHSYHNDLPGPEHLYHFALRVEDAWTQELVTRLGAGLPDNQMLAFPCQKSAFTDQLFGLASPNDIREIRLSRHELQFVYDDRVESLPLRDLGSFQANRGVLKFQQDDASWFGRKGKFRIDYQHLGNAQAFFYYLALALSGQ